MSEEVKNNLATVEESLPQHEISSASRCEGILDTQECNASKSTLKTNIGPEIVIPINKVQEEKQTRDLTKEEMSPGKKKLYTRLNKQMKIEMTDGRVLVGIFLCTDRDANVILGSCTEYLNPEVCGFTDEPRILGLVMVPGRHIVSIHHDASETQLLIMPEEKESGCPKKLEQFEELFP